MKKVFNCDVKFTLNLASRPRSNILKFLKFFIKVENYEQMHLEELMRYLDDFAVCNKMTPPSRMDDIIGSNGTHCPICLGCAATENLRGYIHPGCRKSFQDFVFRNSLTHLPFCTPASRIPTKVLGAATDRFVYQTMIIFKYFINRLPTGIIMHL